MFASSMSQTTPATFGLRQRHDSKRLCRDCGANGRCLKCLCDSNLATRCWAAVQTCQFEHPVDEATGSYRVVGLIKILDTFIVWKRPRAYGHELVAEMSRVQVLVPLKTCLLERLMNVKSVVAESLLIRVVWKEEWALARVSSSLLDRDSKLQGP
ncbi:hypothetical protein TNCV_1687641 [Trichonephila clavipes]|nr:hypothetical protein TNCV_1687641 [Trichonephila clavipes]